MKPFEIEVETHPGLKYFDVIPGMIGENAQHVTWENYLYLLVSCVFIAAMALLSSKFYNMRKRLLMVGIVSVLIISLVYVVWQAYDFSSDYNYATAKLDIKNGNIRIINVGIPKISSIDKEIEKVSTRYGFKNIYIKKFTPQQTEKGIKDYNDLINKYLSYRNGLNWKIKYQKEVDSLYKLARPVKNYE